MKIRFVIACWLSCSIVLAACSPATAPTKAPDVLTVVQTVMVEGAVQAPVATEAPAARELEGGSGAYPAVGATAAPPEGVKGQNSELALPNPAAGRMIIKDALMDLLVADPELAIERVTQLAADQGGYLVSSRAWMEEGFKNAELKMGVPSAHFEDTLNQLRRMAAQVLNEETSGQDVSADYADLSARLVNLEATSARVREFLTQAKNVEESLKINAQLSELEGQIEQVKGQMKFYEGRSAYSTITVLLRPQRPTPTATLTPTTTPTLTAKPGWNPGKTAGSASKVMVKLLQGGVDLMIWAALLLWPFALALLVIWWVIRRLQRKGEKKPAGESR